MSRWIFLIALSIAALAGCEKKPPPAPKPQEAAVPASAMTSLSPAERQEFYHLPEGSELIPLDLMRAVESARTSKPFIEDLERFGLIPDPSDPDGLPVGIAAAMVDGKRAEPRMVFFNCAACHTAEIRHAGKAIRVDGAPGHVDMVGFIGELLVSFDATVKDPKKLAAFLERLARLRHGGADLAKAFPDLGLPGDKPEGALLDKVTKLVEKEKAKAVAALDEKKVRLDSAADALALLKEKILFLQRLRGLRVATAPGFGRLDAFVGTRNLVFGDKHALEPNAPVSMPPLFGLSRLTWYHYDNNTTSIVQRNIVEDLGVGAVVNLDTGESAVQIRNLVRLEQLAAKFAPPKWPAEVLGGLDAARVAKGEAIYKKECASCHEADPDGTFPDRTFDLATIGTDPNRAEIFARPLGDRPFVEVFAGALDKVQKKAFEREHVTPEEAAKFERHPVEWRATKKYAVRPLDGVWATAPYLHNGSVPTLYDLLLPPERRPKTFFTGSQEYEPKKVGFVSDGSRGGTFRFDTAADGNRNTGHTYGTSLGEEERFDLIEYLKGR